MMCDNFPFHQPIWLLCSFESVDIYYANTYRRQSVESGTVLVWELEPHWLSASAHISFVFCCTLPSHWVPLSSTLTRCITRRIWGVLQVDGFFYRPDIVGNLHFGVTVWSWLGKTKYLFPRPAFPTFFLAALHFLQNVGKPGKWNLPYGKYWVCWTKPDLWFILEFVNIVAT